MILLRLVRAALIGIFIAAALPAEAKQPGPDYTEGDGGYLVYSAGTIRIGMEFSFPYRRTALSNGTIADDWKGLIEPSTGGTWTKKIKTPDFTGFETGHVIIRRLPPGHYAITNFGFAGSSPFGGSYAWSSAKPFSMEFDIKPGRATYIGSFMRSPTPKPELRAQLGYAGYFLIADRSERDLPLARAKLPLLPSADIQVTDVEQFGSAALRNHSLE